MGLNALQLKRFMRILAFVPGGIGDQILFFPTLDRLKLRYPDAQTDVVVSPSAVPAYQVTNSAKGTIPFLFQARNSLADWGNLLGTLRDREYDVVLNLRSDWSTNFLLWLSGIPVRIGFAGSQGENFLTRRIKASANAQQYLAEDPYVLLKGLDIEDPCPELAVTVKTQDLAWADDERKRLGISSGGYVMIYGGGQGSDRYPIKSWRLVLEDFQKKQPNLPLVLLQDDSWEGIVEELRLGMPNLKITTPQNLGHAVSLLTGASLVLCSESDMLNLSVAAKTFTLGLLGAGKPTRLLPKSDRCVGIKSQSDRLADIAPSTILEKVWNG
jgi:ADP-heptose:LPS heptosyltransferase